MSLPARRPATYADLEALPETMVGELIEGELFASPRPAGPHTVAASRFGSLIGAPFDFGRGGPGGWWILDEPELHLQGAYRGDVLVPDLAGWKKDRMPAAPSGVAFTVVPDWVCEVLSPSTRKLDRVRKLPIYGRAGVNHAWLIDPIDQLVETYRWVEGGQFLLVSTTTGSVQARLEPFDAVELDLSLVWPGPAK